MSDVVAQLAALACDAILVTLFYKWANNTNREADEIRRAPQVTLGEDLLKDLSSSDVGYLAYACVEGAVIPTNQLLSSQNVSSQTGVIRHTTLVEHKSKRIEGLWKDVKTTILDKLQAVPFKLRRLLGGETDAEIHVMQVNDAHFIKNDLCVTYDHFEPANPGVLERGIDRVFGESIKGYHETEKMLLTNTMLLGVGEIALVDGKLQLGPPRTGAMYILTKMSRAEVIKLLENRSFWIKILTIGTGIVGLGLLSYILIVQYEQWRENREREDFLSEVRARREERFAGRQADHDGNASDDEANCCVVCLTNPREIVLLDCGHICLCADCVLQLQVPMLCPVCRQSVDRYITTYNA